MTNSNQHGATYTKSIQIDTAWTDLNGRLRLDRLCGFLQDCAAEHAQLLGVGTQLKEKSLVWVLSKMKLEVQGKIRANSNITIQTWPKGVDKLFALRDFAIRDASGQVLANATTSWLLINLTNKRPRRVDMVTSSFENHLVDALDSTYQQISAPLEWSIQEPYEVAKSDLDDNMHSNNVSYLRWFLDVLPKELQDRMITGLEIHFLAETFLADQLLIKEHWNSQTKDKLLLEVSRPRDRKAVAKAKMKLL